MNMKMTINLAVVKYVVLLVMVVWMPSCTNLDTSAQLLEAKVQGDRNIHRYVQLE